MKKTSGQDIQSNLYHCIKALLNPNSPILMWVIKIGVGLAILIFLINWINPEKLADAFVKSDKKFLLAALALMPINVLLQIFRWQIILRDELPDVKFTRVAGSVFGGLALGLLTPGRTGEIARVFLLRADSRLRLAALHVLDKFYTFGAVTFTGPLLILLLPGFVDNLPERLRPGAFILSSLFILLYLWISLDPRPLKSLVLAFQLVFGKKEKILQLLKVYEGFSIGTCALALFLTVSQLFIIFTQFFLVTNAFTPVSWLTATHTYAGTLFVKTALPISLGSLGIGEFASVSLYSLFGIDQATAFNSSLLLFAFNVLLPSLFGMVYLLIMRIPLSSMNNIQKGTRAA